MDQVQRVVSQLNNNQASWGNKPFTVRQSNAMLRFDCEISGYSDTAGGFQWYLKIYRGATLLRIKIFK